MSDANRLLALSPFAARRFWRGLAALLLTFFTGALPVAALDSQTAADGYLIQGWQTESGLPSNKIRAIRQTRDGYLWLATEKGAVRFDGDRFEVFNHSTQPDFPSTIFLDMAETADGTLWLASGSGLFSWRGGQFHRLAIKDGLASDHIQSLVLRRDGSLMIGTDHGVSFLRDNGISTPGGIWNQMTGNIRAYAQRADGAQYLGTEHGLWRITGEQIEKLSGRSVPGSSFNSFLEDPDGRFWMGSSVGLRCVYPDGRVETFGQAEGLTNLRIQCLLRDRDSNLWIGTGGGLFRMHDGHIEPAVYAGAFGATTISSLYEDRDGTLWIGSFSGLFCLRNPSFHAIGLKEGLTQTGITSITETQDGTWWIGTWGGGVFRRAPDQTITRFPLAGSVTNQIFSFGETTDGALWIGDSSLGAFRYADGKLVSFYLAVDADKFLSKLAAQPDLVLPGIPHQHVFTIASDNAGGAWIGTDGALYRASDEKFRVISNGLAPGRTNFRSVIQTHAGAVWVATSQGVARMEAGRWTVYRTVDGLSTDDTRSVFEDSTGSIWVTTLNSGLNRFKGGRWRSYSTHQGLIDDSAINMIEDDDGFLWIGTLHGIMRIARREFDDLDAGRISAVHPRLFTKADGMPISECNSRGSPGAWKTHDGRLLFPTDAGVAVVDPRRVTLDHRAPPVYIERMSVDGRETDFAALPSISSSSHDLEFFYTAVSLLSPERVHFKVKLWPIDTDWHDAGNRRDFHYSRLPYGNYSFQVIAANSDGVWNLQGASCSFRVLPFFYQTTWFRISVVLAVVAVVAVAFRWRVRRLHQRARELRRHNLELERGIAERTRELALANSAKTEFLENISHEIRNPLNGIIGLVAMLREASLATRERELAHSLSACAKVLARVFDQVLNFAKLEHGHVPVREIRFALSSLIDEVAALFRITARQRGSEISIRRDANVPDNFIGDEEKIELILTNFVNNALKYAPGTPVEILIQCTSADEYGADITFNVTDRGPGIPPEEQEQIFQKFVRGSREKERRTAGAGLGLATCRALAELLGGHVGVESELGHGATFFLTLRLKLDRNVEPAAIYLSPQPIVSPEAHALIVEDQPYNQVVVRRMAERLGFAGEVARDADEALARLARHAYAVVFIDWELPGMKGDELARKIRTQPNGRDAILIATTAHDSADIQRQCFAAGMDAFALKPFDVETIARLLDEARSRRGSIRHESTAQLDTRVFSFVGYDDPQQAEQAALLYSDILDQEMAVFTAALDRHDLPAAAQAAHRLKSHAGLVGAAELREVAERVQREAATASAEELADLRRELLRHATVLQERLKSWRTANAVG